MSHTPGPWEANILKAGNSERTYAVGFAIRVAGKIPHVCGCNAAPLDNSVSVVAPEYARLHENRFSPEEAEANARLIAAAPELLEACKLALIECQGVHDVMMLSPQNRGMKPAAIIAQLTAAIAKAEGKQ